MTTTHMLQLELDMPRLFALCERQRLPRIEDLGHAVHCGLAAAFGEQAPSLFAVTGERGRVLELLAYSAHPLEHLRERAEQFADPDAFRLLDWDRSADKPMPTRWRAGQNLSFRLRACPTVRVAKDGPFARSGAEVDAFLAAAWRESDGPKPDRHQIYLEWLRAALDRSEGARLQHAQLQRFALQTLLRRTQGAERHAKAGLRKPDVTFDGVLEVLDPEGFERLLRRGVGRHRAFGFGMLLLRPVRSPAC